MAIDSHERVHWVGEGRCEVDMIRVGRKVIDVSKESSTWYVLVEGKEVLVVEEGKIIDRIEGVESMVRTKSDTVFLIS